MILAAILILLVYIITLLLSIKSAIKTQDIRNKETTDWIFDSLYSINHNVKLPEHKEEIKETPAIVTSDKTNPMKEFSGDHDDYFS